MTKFLSPIERLYPQSQQYTTNTNKKLNYEEVFNQTHSVATEAALASPEINRGGIEVSVGIFYTNEFARYLIKKRGFRIRYARVQIPITAEPQKVYAEKFIYELSKHGIKGYVEEYSADYNLWDWILFFFRWLFQEKKQHPIKYKVVQPEDWFGEHNKHGGYTKEIFNDEYKLVWIVCKCGERYLTSDKK
jgi:hypothetical protein